MAATEFRRFRDLPPELRLAIWSFCIPGPRVHEMESLDPDNHTILPTLPYRSHKLLPSKCGLFPVISHVCREAREAVLKHHGMVYLTGEDATQTDQDGKPYPRWEYWNETSPMRLRKGLDIVHLHWHPEYDRHVYMPPAPDPFPSFHWLANQAGAASISAELLLPFEPTRHLPDTLNHNQIRYFSPHAQYHVVLAIVEIHMSNDEAAHADIFGVLGEEPVKLVDPRDTAAVAKFRDAWRRHRLPLEEPDVADFFSRAIESAEAYGESVDRWCLRLEKQWMTKVADGAGDDIKSKIWMGQNSSTRDPFDIPHGPLRFPILGIDRMKELNKELPWVQERLTLMPRFEPAVMFRHCSNMCGLPSEPTRRIVRPAPPRLGGRQTGWG